MRNFHVFVRKAGFCLLAAMYLILVDAAFSAPRQVLKGHVPAAVAGLVPLDRLDPAKHLDLAISLPFRNREALTNLLAELYDPASPQYRRFLTSGQFTGLFGPTTNDFNALIEFAEAHHLKVTGKHSNRMLITVNGAVSNIEQAFSIELHHYPHPTEARTFFAPDREPSLDFETTVLEINGLDNFQLPHSAGLHPSGHPQPEAGSGSGGEYLGDDFRDAYLPGVALTGAGQNIGLVEFNGYYTNDINAYKTLAGRTNTVTTILTDSYNGVPSGGTGEDSLDIDMAMSMAPGAVILVYEGMSGSVILSRIASDNLVKQASCSWNFTVNSTSEQALQQCALQGQSLFQASGDHLATVGPAFAPEDNPYMTVCGGTELSTTGPKGAWTGEVVWHSSATTGSSGGSSTVFALPVWQRDINMVANHGSTTMRNTPDVAISADRLFCVADNGTNLDEAGTSAAAPLWAGFMALVNQQAVAQGQPTIGFADPAIYDIARSSNYSLCFHDITVGNNTNASSPTNYFAMPGYDLCTGWGSPTGSNLINTLIGSRNYAVAVLNGGFDDYNFNYWSLTANTAYTFVTTNVVFVHGGNEGARLQQIGSLGQLAQTLTTVAGQAYLISFWLENPTNGTPNQFIASWNGLTLFNQTNLPVFAWTNLNFVVRANNSQATLAFQFRNDAAPFGLDDVGVAAEPAPDIQVFTQSSTTLSFTWPALAGLEYQIQYSTNLYSGWTNVGNILTAAGSTASASETLPTNATGFYRVALLPN